jgi:hypothetical protein
MLERGLVSRILFPAPPPSYDVDCFPHDLIWVPKAQAAVSRPEDPSACPPIEDCIPCLLLTYPSARFLIIFFHSNAEDLGRCHGFCCYIRDQFQVHVLAVEYPGYGICPGVPSGETVMENALAAMKFVTDTLQWPMDSIKVFGRSIGTGPAIGLASIFSLAGLILVTPFLSVQELFRDRVGPLAGFVEEWFPNRDSAPKITSPTMIIHGQRDELIACRHGESIYELLRPRKLLISPPEMEHNTNLLTNMQFFVLPMFQFFALPDYAFQDLQVPPWAFDKRRSPFYIRPCVEISSHQLPNTIGKKKMMIPAGDDGTMPATSDSPHGKVSEAIMNAKLMRGSEKALKGEVIAQAPRPPHPDGRVLEPMFSSKDTTTSDAEAALKPIGPEDEAPCLQPSPLTGPLLIASPATEVADQSKVAQEKPLSMMKGRLFQQSDDRVPQGALGAWTPPSSARNASAGAATPPSSPLSSPRAPPNDLTSNIKPVKLPPDSEEAITRLNMSKINFGDICSDELNVQEERVDADAVERERLQDKAALFVQECQVAAGSPTEQNTERQGARMVWSSWCGKPPDVRSEEVKTKASSSAPAPGLPPSIVCDDGVPKGCFNSNGKGSWPSSSTSSTKRSGRDGSSDVVQKSSAMADDVLKSQSAGGVSPIKNPLLAACCRALPSDPPLGCVSSLPRPHVGSFDDEPVVTAPFGGRVISGSRQTMTPEEQIWRRYPLGTEVGLPPKRQAEDKAPVSVLANGFQRGTKFAI